MERLFKIYPITNLRAREYFIRQLAGGTSLAHRINAQTALTEGPLFIALPEGVDSSELSDFDSSGGFQHVLGAGAETLARIVKAYISDLAHGVLIQDTEASINDTWLQDYKYRDRVLTYDQELYWQIVGCDLANDDIAAIISSGSLYPSGVFFHEAELEHRQVELDDVDLDRITRALAGVAVGALDEQSFLLWWSGRVPLPFTPGTRP